ncbi:MAG: DUF4349 domain-containing protein [Caulobacterales bacterium]
MRAGMIAVALLLVACGDQNMSAPTGVAAPPAPMDAPQMEAARGGAAGEGYAVDAAAEERQSAQQPSPSEPGDPVTYLAYSYAIGMELPGDRLIGVMSAHEKACRDAGPRRCQLVGSARSGDPQSYLSGNISLRGEPTWLRGFMNSLEGQARDAGGDVKSQSTSTEDLTRAIIDTEATLRAKTALRERLQELLRSRPGKLSDLLEVERELARVQGEIDSTTSNLAAMRTRVSMSALSLTYESKARPVASDTFEPLAQAFSSFLSIVVQGFAAIIMIVAGLLPFAIVFALLGWLALWIRKKRGGRFIQRKTPAPNTES